MPNSQDLPTIISVCGASEWSPVSTVLRGLWEDAGLRVHQVRGAWWAAHTDYCCRKVEWWYQICQLTPEGGRKKNKHSFASSIFHTAQCNFTPEIKGTNLLFRNLGIWCVCACVCVRITDSWSFIHCYSYFVTSKRSCDSRTFTLHHLHVSSVFLSSQEGILDSDAKLWRFLGDLVTWILVCLLLIL